MKKRLLSSLLIVPTVLSAQTTILTENFDSYIFGNTIAAESAGVWETWSGGVGTNEDAFVSSAQANSGANSMNVYNLGPSSYLHDVVLNFPSVYTSGRYIFNCKVYVPAGKGGYFNLGSVWATGGAGYEYGMNIYFNSNGSGHITSSGTGAFSYIQDSWTDVNVDINLDTGWYTVYINSNIVIITNWEATSGLGVLDVFGFAYTNTLETNETTSNFFVDDIELIDWTGVGISEHNEIAINVLPNPSDGQFMINLNNINAGEYKLSIIDMLGNLVHNENLNITEKSSLNYDLNLATGIYYINISNGINSSIQKLVVK